MTDSRMDRRRFLAGLAALSAFPGVVARADQGREQEISGVSARLLGTAQDGGLPQAGCGGEHCQAARNDPAKRRRTPCLAVMDSHEKKVFCLDAGPDFNQQIYDLPPWGQGRNLLHGIALTHGHIGHYTGLMYLGREALGSNGIPVWCSPGMAAFLRGNGPWNLLVELGNIVIFELLPGKPVPLTGRLSLEALAVPHRAEFTDTYGFIVRGPSMSLLYLPDIDRWEPMQPAIETVLRRVDVALVDGTFYSGDELPGRDMSKIPHPLITTSMDRFQSMVDAGQTRIIFTHLNHSNLVLDEDGSTLKTVRSRGYEIAEEGMQISL